MKTFKFLLLTLVTLLFISCSSTTVFQYSTQSNTMYLGNKKTPIKESKNIAFFLNPKYNKILDVNVKKR